MSCLDYRRALAAGEAETTQMKAHRLQCTACAEAFAGEAAFERELRRGMEVDVPPHFDGALRHSLASSRRRFLAAAGAAALAAGAGAYAWLARDGPVALACIDFVMKEEAKSIMMGAMPREQAAAALAGTLPLERMERIGQVRHVGPCPFNGGTAYHVVLGVPQGKVTLLVMPDSTMASPERARHEGLYASVVALASGSVGIVGTDPGVVESVAGALRA